MARAHTLFGSVYPFDDGDSRAGRILLDSLANSKGYPPIAIKGITAGERQRYCAALGAADTGFHIGF